MTEERSTVGRLLIFTRYPEPGRVKTRLIPALGPTGAADLHRWLTAHTLAWARTLADRQAIRVEVHFDGGDTRLMQASFGNELCYRPQTEGDLGERLISVLANSVGPTIIVGSDCPALNVERAIGAFNALLTHDVVLGPSSDGGYYLIGLNRPAPELFSGIHWGTNQVCVQTQTAAARQGLSVVLLEVLTDIDRPEDLAILDR